MPKPRYYWDAGPFIAHLMDEQRPDPTELGGAREVLAIVDAGEAYLLTSSLTTVEVLNREGDGTVRERFEKLFERVHYRRIDTSLPIHQRAAELREQIGLKTPDAIHLATAVVWQADEFHTFDGRILGLNGRLELGELRICKPSAEQKRLNL